MTNKCNHQWFEVRKLWKATRDRSPDSMALNGYPNDGVKIQCANCDKVKTLWGEPNDE